MQLCSVAANIPVCTKKTRLNHLYFNTHSLLNLQYHYNSPILQKSPPTCIPNHQPIGNNLNIFLNPFETQLLYGLIGLLDSWYIYLNLCVNFGLLAVNKCAIVEVRAAVVKVVRTYKIWTKKTPRISKLQPKMQSFFLILFFFIF